MNKKRILESIRKKKPRTFGFVHIGEIIPGVLKDIERRMKESHKDKRVNLGTEIEERRE